MKIKQRRDGTRDGNLLIGIVSVAGNERGVSEAVVALRTLGYGEGDMVINSVPGEMELVMGARLFAEGSNVDGLLVLSQTDPNSSSALAATVVQGLNMVSIDWNFPIIMSSAYSSTVEAVAALLQMIELQIAMEPDQMPMPTVPTDFSFS